VTAETFFCSVETKLWGTQLCYLWVAVPPVRLRLIWCRWDNGVFCVGMNVVIRPMYLTLFWRCIYVVKPTRCINVSYLFYWSNDLHVSDGLSVHHQELKTVHTATGICQADTAVCWRQQFLLGICLLQYVQFLTPVGGRKDRPKPVECYSNKINMRHWCIWLVLL